MPPTFPTTAEALHARSSWALRGAILALAVSLVGCDHATKIAAEASLSGGRTVNVVSGVLELRYTPNPDTAFSLLHALGIPRSPALLLAASVIALVGVVVAWIGRGKRAGRSEHLGFALRRSCCGCWPTSTRRNDMADAVAADAKVEGTEPIEEAEPEFIELYSGAALSATDAEVITLRSPTHLVVFAGAEGSGKTTVLTSIYERLNQGAFAGFKFAGSRSLLGFEELCHLNRLASGGTQHGHAAHETD